MTNQLKTMNNRITPPRNPQAKSCIQAAVSCFFSVNHRPALRTASPKSAPLLLLFWLLFPLSLQAAYQYYYSDTFTTIDTTKWNQNGSIVSSGGYIYATTQAVKEFTFPMTLFPDGSISPTAVFGCSTASQPARSRMPAPAIQP
jgi:hypothetical protein